MQCTTSLPLVQNWKPIICTKKQDDDQSIPEIEKCISEKLTIEVSEVNIEDEMNTDDDVEINFEPVELEIKKMVVFAYISVFLFHFFILSSVKYVSCWYPSQY